MKNMRKTAMTAAVFLMALAFVTAFTDEALARPPWVTVKYTGWNFRVQKNTKENGGTHVRVVFNFDIINNSKNGDIMTAIYNRTISWNGVFTLEIPFTRSDGSIYYSFKDASAKYSMRGTDPYKGEWWPGQVYKYEHSVPLSAIMKPIGNWTATNRGFTRVKYAKVSRPPAKPKFRMGKWSLDFQVRSHK